MAGIYLHIPFCKQACYYCDFHFSTTMRLRDYFVKALLEEIKLQRDYLGDEPIKTIYFGGGTPSLLTYDNLMEILDTIFATYIIGVNPEITLEANPDDLSLMKLKDLSKTPINRLSIGVQSFFDEDLRFMNRVHNANEAIKSIKYAQDVGLDNLTIDLIYGTPTLSYDNWKKNLETSFSLEIPHLSCYCLTIEPKTALADFIKKGNAPNVDEQKSASQFEIMLELMEKNGYEQYEISNFCKDERYSKHNSAYWLKENYLGLGPSAHSFNGNSRQWNIANNSLYIESISKGIIPHEKEILNQAQQFNEYILTSLRTKWGVNIYRVEKDFGGEIKTAFMNQVNEYVDKGLLVWDDKKEIVLLTKEGKLLADNITSELFIDA